MSAGHAVLQGDGGGARALQRRLVHAYERGEMETPPGRRYSPRIRLALLLGATASLWWSVYALAQTALGGAG